MRPSALLSRLGLVAMATGCTLTGTVGVVGQTEGSTESDDDGRPGTSGPLPDLGREDQAACEDRSDMPDGPPCTLEAPPDSFEATLQWQWTGPDGDTDSLVIPLVANLTDDDGNGRVDLCDVPDVVVTAGPPAPATLGLGVPPARLYALDGATGALHWSSELRVRATVTPALGDLDGDGAVEIVALAPAATPDVSPYPSQLVVFEADGSLAWRSDEDFEATSADAVALADLDGDGLVEIMVADHVFDHRGTPLIVAPQVRGTTSMGLRIDAPLMPFGVDLDRDGDLEVLWARGAFHHDGTELYFDPEGPHGYAQVADLDRDGDPEVVLTTADGIGILDAEGNARMTIRRFEGIAAGLGNWHRPLAIHDIDGDRAPDLLASAGDLLLVLQPDPTLGQASVLWSASVDDANGSAAGTAFDFLGDGRAEAIYADERRLYAFDIAGVPVLSTDRSSITQQEYPVVADVDDDGSAEMLVVNNASAGTAPTLMVLGEAAG
ncbi:MAG: VCBS repeat-containing protein, partial [Myxococcales bacterium]|nr:VCBS repeat-containing protein [Myxococcales bacterium]